MTTDASPISRYSQPVLFIDGRWEAWEGDPTGAPEVVDPASGAVLGRTPAASTRQVEAAVSAAARAFPAWSRLAGKDRGDVLRRAADALAGSLDDDSATITLEQGKTLGESRAEMVSIVDLFRWYADQADRPAVRTEPGSVEGGDVTVQHLPVGPVAIQTPWNFPASLAARKLAAAFAVGCTAVVKPAPETPASFLAVARAFEEAGLPAGVLNVVNGDPVRISRELIESAEIRAVSFTGSTRVGREIGRLAGGALTRATLELGGHAPVIVTGDVDVAAVARTLATTKYRNAGQVCISPTRFLVERGVYEEFVDRFVDYASGLRVGPGLDDGVEMGPLAVDRRRRSLLELIDSTVIAGATVRCGGEALDGPGWFVAPTVLTDVPTSSAAMNEEPFGPLALINPYLTDDEAVAEANRLPVGLAAYLFSGSAERAAGLVGRIEAGTVGVNTGVIVHRDSPLSGIKNSGYGSDGGLEGMQEFQQVRAVSVLPDPDNWASGGGAASGRRASNVGARAQGAAR
ncbi:MAG: succinate-semialdehyde dehydrogenase / glutarate-semialdehyde dehydrogenase [Actinomycetota bacterium]|nr:succinate-semialdehyde dehydrogenase / glutarate-semialdehyde dehydrogenase [Actinomycetota bacterium]